MGKLTIELTKTPINSLFKNAFNGKTFEVNMPDAEMEGATDKLKKKDNLKDGEKLKKTLKDVKPVKDHLFGLFDNAKFTSNIEDLGKHELEAKFKDNQTVKATLKLLSSSGAETRVVASTEPRKLGAHPKSVKIENAANAVRGNCPYHDDLANLLRNMAKVESYVWSGKQGLGNGWTPQIHGHFSHVEPDVAGWKSYIDEPSMGTGTTWRLLYKLKFVENSEQVVIDIHSVRQEH